VFRTFIAHFSIGISTCCPSYISSLLFNLVPAIAYQTSPCGSVASKTDPFNSFSSLYFPYCSHFLPLSSANWNPFSCSQTAWLTTHQAFLAEDPWITHFGLASIKTWSCHCPTLYTLYTAFTNHPEVWTNKEV